MRMDKRSTLSLGGVLFLALMMAAGWTRDACAQAPLDPNIHADPASILIFPLFDSRDNNGTMISVTNTNRSRGSCGNTFLNGDVCLHYIYIGGDTTDDPIECREFDRTECLTPGDTLTVLADRHNPAQVEGWLWVEARDPETLQPIKFNFIIGSAIIVQADDPVDFMWSYTPYAFEALCTGGASSDCGYCFTDKDHDGKADFDGNEYEPFPDELVLDNFFAEGGGISNELTLMSVREIGQTNLSVLIWNNDEVRFSQGFVFECFTRGPLSAISNIVRRENLGGIKGNQPEKFQTGWMEFRSTQGILGVFKHTVNRANFKFGAGHELHVVGQQNISLQRL